MDSPERKPFFLEEHLNVNWLRPESALWDAIASGHIAEHVFDPPSLDLGSGNGLFSFVTAGGALALSYDWYQNAEPEGFWENRDIYDTVVDLPTKQSIVRSPRYVIDCALDHKVSLGRQAAALGGFYRRVLIADATRTLPVGDATFQTVFSNILYWLDSPEEALRQVWRILRPGGRALLCLQNTRFEEYCSSYRWEQSGSNLLRLVNCGRSQLGLWTISYRELSAISARIGFEMMAHRYYLSPLTLKTWDIGLRPLSPVLIKMARRLSERDRLEVKLEWLETLTPFLRELYELDQKSTDQGGFHFVCLGKS